MRLPPMLPVLRERVLVRGIVQGVGFRPFVYRLARALGLVGWVSNSAAGVCLEVEGAEELIDEFVRRLELEAPPLALIDAVTRERMKPATADGFVIAASGVAPGEHTLLAPDAATCGDCLRELFDPADRRYRYPFLNCTNCGPRFTIIEALPYDRPATTMGSFLLCAECRAEYEDPANRRFHAQPTACPACGPVLALGSHRGEAALEAAIAILRSGGTVAVKGVGGFHLACDASNPAAVALLRRRKNRPDQPLGLMAREAALVGPVSAVEARLLASAAAPIVILPGQPSVGVMLPYTPLHHLLVAAIPVLVMTSGNVHGQPIVHDNAEALRSLAPLADGILLHDRGIAQPCDDSVIRVLEGRPVPVRRSRGYAPVPIRLAEAVGPVLAVGGELKATFCLAQGREAFVSAHLGDMENLETLEAFERAYQHLSKLLGIVPEQIYCDAHPQYLSSWWAQRQGLPVRRVQHHFAHAAAVLAEYGVPAEEPVLAVIYDGTGYGDDGAIWGGELLLARRGGFTRLAHLPYVPLPGGDAAIRHPERLARAHLFAAGLAWAKPDRNFELQLRRQIQCVPTSSMGRLFDAVAGQLGLRSVITYEAQAAIELEDLAGTVEDAGSYPLSFETLTPFWHALVDDQAAGVSAAVIARRFHNSVIEATVALCSAHRGPSTVVLAGGVFHNVLLLQGLRAGLTAAGFAVLVPRLLPPNDAGLALGQVWAGTALPTG